MEGRWEREVQEESNIPSRRDLHEDTNRSTELESSVTCMTQDMLMMKEKMEMMMNAIKG